jgi:hypothetical protein
MSEFTGGTVMSARIPDLNLPKSRAASQSAVTVLAADSGEKPNKALPTEISNNRILLLLKRHLLLVRKSGRVCDGAVSVVAAFGGDQAQHPDSPRQ